MSFPQNYLLKLDTYKHTPMMDYQLFSQLRPGNHTKPIRARIVRKWFGVNYKKQRTNTFELLLVDEEGNGIQAYMFKSQSDQEDNTIIEGQIYFISNFRVTGPKTLFNVLRAQHSMAISRDTCFVREQNPGHPVPLYYFQFTDFADLCTRVKDNTLLSDVIGLITSMSDVTPVYVAGQNQSIPKRVIELKNTRNETVLLTLWGEFAETFDAQLITNNACPILILAASTVYEFQDRTSLSTCSSSRLYIDLQIPQVQEMKEWFEPQVTPVQQIQLPQQQQLSSTERENLNRATIAALIQSYNTDLEPSTFTCIATIKYIDETQGWYYTTCKVCYKSLVEIGGSLICPKHKKKDPYSAFKLALVVEDETDTATFLAFGKIAEKLTDTTVDTISLLGKTNRYNVPDFLKNLLVGKTVIFNVTAMKKKQYPEDICFRINTARILNEQPPQTTQLLLPGPSASQSSSQPQNQSTTGEKVEEIPPDLFEQDTPTKIAPPSIDSSKKKTTEREGPMPAPVARKLKIKDESEIKGGADHHPSKETTKLKQSISPKIEDPTAKKLKQR